MKYLSDVQVSCSFKEQYGLYCPGCGGTRALDELLQFDFMESFLYNPLIILLIVYAIVVIISFMLFFISKEKLKHIKIIMISSILALIAIGLVFVIRNCLLVYGGIDLLGDLS